MCNLLANRDDNDYDFYYYYSLFDQLWASLPIGLPFSGAGSLQAEPFFGRIQIAQEQCEIQHDRIYIHTSLNYPVNSRLKTHNQARVSPIQVAPRASIDFGQ